MKKAKSILVILVILALAVFTLTACGNDKENGGDAPVCEHRDADDNSLCDKCGEAFVDDVDIAESSEGLDFELNEDGETYTVTGIGTCTDSDIIICLYNGAPVTGIGRNAFGERYEITGVTIGNSVTSIGEGAFYQCYGLTSAVISDSVTSVGSKAFYGCISLTSVKIGNGVTSIGENAFRSCQNLTSVAIPDSVTSIGNRAFAYCYKITHITVDEDNSNYKSIDGSLYSKDGKALIQYAIGKTEEAFVIPDSVTSICDAAFYGCRGVTSLTIHEGVTDIGDEAFADCDGLTSIVIPNSVTSIGNVAFWHCFGLTSVTIGNGVTSIGKGAFV